MKGGEKEIIEQEKEGGESENTFNNYRIINDVGVRGSEYGSGSG